MAAIVDYYNWFDHVSYRVRVLVAAFCMATAFGLVGADPNFRFTIFGCGDGISAV